MALKTFVKINAVNNLSDARYCAGMYVNLLGFQVSPALETAVDPQSFKEITGWVSGVEFVAEFEQEELEEVKEILESYDVSWVEHTRLDPLIDLSSTGINCIYKQDMTNVKSVKLELAERLKENNITLHITSEHEELSERELELVQTLSQHCDVILGSGISADNVTSLIESYPIKGITLTGGDEIKPGLKDFDELADILETLEIED